MGDMWAKTACKRLEVKQEIGSANFPYVEFGVYTPSWALRSGSSSGPVVIGACVWVLDPHQSAVAGVLLCFTVLLRSRAQCVSNACATSLLGKRLPGHRPNQAVQISRLLPADACSAAQTCTKHHSSKILQCGHSPISAYRLSPVSSRPTAHMTPTLKTAMRRTTTVRPQLQDNTTT